MKETLYQKCISAGRLDLLAEWDEGKNAPLAPWTLEADKRRSVWWRCAEGHSWEAPASARLKGRGCPVCANRKIVPGVNDLATLLPALAAEWDAEKNAPLTPGEVGTGSRRQVWWRCAEGHAWRAAVSNRARGGCGCPVCAGRVAVPGESDLATFSPRLAAEWHPTKNGALTPDQLRPRSARAVWWRCEKGHAWKAVVNARVQSGSGCPYCSNRLVLTGFNDLATTDPQIAAQWAYELNGGLTPELVTRGSHKKVWWRCAEGHTWRTVVYARTGAERSGCPVCAGRVKERRPASLPRPEAAR